MFAAICLAVSLSPAAAPPAPLPDRWLLKLVPDNLPALPDRFYMVSWYDSHRAQHFGHSWDFWVEFRKPEAGRPAEASLTLSSWKQTDRPPAQDFESLPPPTRPGSASVPHRSVPLAVYGPLIEFEGKLYTATTRTRKDSSAPKQEREMLYLGSAVELKDRVWYQAGTTTGNSGTATAEEWRLEFQDDPRTKDAGTATILGHRRVLTEPEGESFAAEVRFKSDPPNDRTLARVVTFLAPEGKKPARTLPYLQISDDRGGVNLIWLDGLNRMALYPVPRPKEPEPPGLVQPPARKPK